jgi:hypothetical protein
MPEGDVTAQLEPSGVCNLESFVIVAHMMPCAGAAEEVPLCIAAAVSPVLRHCRTRGSVRDSHTKILPFVSCRSPIRSPPSNTRSISIGSSSTPPPVPPTCPSPPPSPSLLARAGLCSRKCSVSKVTPCTARFSSSSLRATKRVSSCSSFQIAFH